MKISDTVIDEIKSAAMLIGIFILTIGTIVAISYISYRENMIKEDEKQSFIYYCMSKGNTQEDCKWEYKRFKNGQHSCIF